MNLLILSIVTALITIPLSALLLWVSAKIFKVQATYVKTLIIAAIIGVAGLIVNQAGALIGRPLITAGISFLLVSVGLALYLIKSQLDLEWGKAALVWLVWFVLSLILGFIVGIIIGIIFAGALITQLA